MEFPLFNFYVKSSVEWRTVKKRMSVCESLSCASVPCSHCHVEYRQGFSSATVFKLIIMALLEFYLANAVCLLLKFKKEKVQADSAKLYFQMKLIIIFQIKKLPSWQTHIFQKECICLTLFSVAVIKHLRLGTLTHSCRAPGISAWLW